MGILKALLSSDGLKRYLAAIIGMFLQVVGQVPALTPMVSVLNELNAALGLAGVAHSAAAGTIPGKVTSTLASVAVVLLGIAQLVPQFAPYVPILQTIVAIFGGATMAHGLALPIEPESETYKSES